MCAFLMRTSLLAACLTLLFSAGASAYPTYHPNAAMGGFVLPPNQASLSCPTCHLNDSGGAGCVNVPCFNPFGRAYRVSTLGWSSPLPGGDSDADGIVNSTELTNGTRPGFPNGATGVSCDMSACGINGSASCGGNVVCTSTMFTYTTGKYWFSFAFSCAAHTSGSVPTNDANWTDNCANINECAGNPCTPGSCNEHALGSWVSPGYTCNCAVPGYAASGGACVITNDCLATPSICVGIASCADTPGAGNYVCTCPAHYMGDGRSSGTGCTDIDECAGNPCGVHGTCAQTPIGSWSSPGYTCNCAPGYGSDGTTCVLANECTSNLDDCAPEAVCADPSAALGDFSCTCPVGEYVGDGRISGTGCTNVNECLDETAYTCTPNASCSDTVGSYDCVCDPGFVAAGALCIDIDECTDENTCPIGETCANVEGSYECLCPPGTSHPPGGGACVVICGDGTRDTTEVCDDGDLDVGDGCDATCKVEAGFFCTGLFGATSTCATTCGDELIDPPETCDDGTRNSDSLPDACRTSCALPYCGDGVTDTGEVCDRGGLAPADANPAACTREGCTAMADAGADGGSDFGGGGGCTAAPGARAPYGILLSVLLFALSLRGPRRR